MFSQDLSGRSANRQNQEEEEAELSSAHSNYGLFIERDVKQ